LRALDTEGLSAHSKDRKRREGRPALVAFLRPHWNEHCHGCRRELGRQTASFLLGSLLRLPALGTGSGRDTSPARAGPSADIVLPHRRAGLTNSSWSLPGTWKGHQGDAGADHFTSACCGVWYLPSEHLAL